MKYVQTLMMVFAFSFCAPALGDDANDPFQEVAANYRAANPKPPFPEEARKSKVQAEFAVREKQFDKAAELYGKALEIAPWWPEGHFNRALILGEEKKYWDAIREMKHYLLLVPDASNARVAQDRIYQWDGVAGPELKIGQAFRDCPDCREMVVLPKLLAMGKFEVTQGEWKAVMGSNPSKFSSCGDTCPVEQVSWNDAQEFIKRLNAKTGKQYRLPTGGEWEYACYGGSQSEYCGGNDLDAVGWADSPFLGRTHPVGGKQANSYGLYDMSGNVWEWMSDCGDGDCTKRKACGGSWGNLPREASTTRGCYYQFEMGIRDDKFGFRLARTLP